MKPIPTPAIAPGRLLRPLRHLMMLLLIAGSAAEPAKIPLLNWEIPAADFQASAWAVWHNKLIPVPRKVDQTSKVRIGGTGGGLDLTVRFFFPVYYGVLYEYMPVYSDVATPTIPGYGTLNSEGHLYAHYFAGAVYVPLGDWIWELFLWKYKEKIGPFYESVLRAPYGKGSYGLHHMYATLSAGPDSSTTSASRVGFTGEVGLMFTVIDRFRVYVAYDYHSIYEDSYYLLGFKGGVAYRYRLGQ